jgi:hypothetical protein
MLASDHGMPRLLLYCLMFAAAQPAVKHTADHQGGAAPVQSRAAREKAQKKLAARFRQRSHSAKPADRIAALGLLDDLPGADAADLVYDTLLANKSAEVRQASVDFLVARRDQDDVASLLLQRTSSTIRKQGLTPRTIAALQVLAGSDKPPLQQRVLESLDGFLGTSEADQFLLHEMIDEQSAQGNARENLRMLQLFSRTKLFDRTFGFRRCVVQGMFQVPDPEAIGAVLELLPHLAGLVRYDAIGYLISATDQDFGDDPEKWNDWWRKNRTTVVHLSKSPAKTLRKYGEFAEYYGIPICADRLVFVLDTSGSMRGSKIDAAKTALIRAIRELKSDVRFDVIAFDGRVRLWQRELVLASEEMKQIAVNMVIEQPLGPMTASYDALEAAFGLAPEAIYFLSDGAPVGGKITDPDEIITTISHHNRLRRVSLHAIGIHTGDGKHNPFGRFMKELATANWGVYKGVN